MDSEGIAKFLGRSLIEMLSKSNAAIQLTDNSVLKLRNYQARILLGAITKRSTFRDQIQEIGPSWWR